LTILWPNKGINKLPLFDSNCVIEETDLPEIKLLDIFNTPIKRKRESDSTDRFKNQPSLYHILPGTLYTLVNPDYLQIFETTLASIIPPNLFSLLNEEDTYTSDKYEDYHEVHLTFYQYEKYNISPETYYVREISNLSNVEAITTGSFNNYKHFKTILNKRDVEIREKIYKVELEMHEIFENETFVFSIDHLENSQELNTFIKDKSVLFYKQFIYA